MAPLLVTGASLALPAIANLIVDLISLPSDDKANQLRATRDALAGRLAADGMPLDQAYQAVDADLAGAIQAGREGGSGAVEMALNAGLAIGGAVMASRGAGPGGLKGMFGKGKGAPAAMKNDTDLMKEAVVKGKAELSAPKNRDEMIKLANIRTPKGVMTTAEKAAGTSVGMKKAGRGNVTDKELMAMEKDVGFKRRPDPTMSADEWEAANLRDAPMDPRKPSLTADEYEAINLRDNPLEADPGGSRAAMDAFADARGLPFDPMGPRLAKASSMRPEVMKRYSQSESGQQAEMDDLLDQLREQIGERNRLLGNLYRYEGG